LKPEPAESAADLKKSGSSKKLKILGEKYCLLTFQNSLHFVSRQVKTRQPPPPPRIFAAQPYLASCRLKLNGSGVCIQQRPKKNILNFHQSYEKMGFMRRLFFPHSDEPRVQYYQTLRYIILTTA
jgi:hypothetical protein